MKPHFQTNKNSKYVPQSHSFSFEVVCRQSHGPTLIPQHKTALESPLSPALPTIPQILEGHLWLQLWFGLNTPACHAAVMSCRPRRWQLMGYQQVFSDLV